MEDMIIKKIAVKTHELEGSDEDKLNFLRGQVDDDLKDATEFPLPPRVFRIYGNTRVNELSFDAYQTLMAQGKSEQIFEEIYKKLNVPESPLRVITCVNNGQIFVDRALFGK